MSSVITAWMGAFHVSWAEETTPGTEQSPNQWLGDVKTVDIIENNNIKRIRHAGSLEFKSWVPGKKDTDFSFTMEVNEGKFFYMVFGDETVVGSTPPYTHTLKCKRPLPAFTFEVAIPNGANWFTRRYIGSKANKCDWRLGVDGTLFADVDCAALEVKKYTAKTTISENSAKPYHFELANVTMNAQAIANLEAFHYTLNNKVAGLNHLGLRKRNGWKEGAPIHDLTMDLTADASTWWDAWFAEPPTEMDANADLKRTATSDEFNFNWFDFPIDKPGLSLPEEGTITQRLTLPLRYAELEIIDSVDQYAA